MSLSTRCLMMVLAVTATHAARGEDWIPELVLSPQNSSIMQVGGWLYCVGVDSEGNAWVTPGGTSRIHRIPRRGWFQECTDSSGEPTPPVFMEPICNDELSFPGSYQSGIDTDDDDNLFAATAGTRIGVMAYFKGSGDYAEQAFILNNHLAAQHLAGCDTLRTTCVDYARGVRVIGNRVYVAAQLSGNAFEVTLNPDHSVASITQLFGPMDAPPGVTVRPTDVDADAAGNVFIAGEGGVFWIAPGGEPVALKIDAGILFDGVRVAQSGSVYFVGYDELWEVAFDPEGTPQQPTLVYSDADDGDVAFRNLSNLAIDQNDVLYAVGGPGADAVVKVDPAAPASQRAMQILGPEGDGSTAFAYGLGIAVNPTGSIVYGVGEGTVNNPSTAFRIRRDLDSDGYTDTFDNCLEVPNGAGQGSGEQCDSDGDGYGNLCDADYNQDGVVGTPDYPFFTAAYGATSSDPNYNAAVDCDCNGVIDDADFDCFAAGFGSPPGPSGLDCADPAICISGNANCSTGPDPNCTILGSY